MDIQVAFNIAVALVAFLGGWVLNSLRSSIDSPQKADTDLITKVQARPYRDDRRELFGQFIAANYGLRVSAYDAEQLLRSA
jgi:hypothetical protein